MQSAILRALTAMVCFAFVDNALAGEAVSKPIVIDAPALSHLDFKLSTGGLPVAPGLETYIVCRADRDHPDAAEGLGYTYQHHVDLASWRGTLYVGWDTCQVDEDIWPSRELISSSTDGKSWSKPVEMFPQGISTPLRMYSFHSRNDRMLIIAGLRVSHEITERTKNALVVRELRADHSPGDVFTLLASTKADHQPPLFSTSADGGFLDACRQLLADTLYLEQQDYGVLLDPQRRMKWFDPQQWDPKGGSGSHAASFGKAFCFFQRADGTLVGLTKMRWVTVSKDGGTNWSEPVQPDSLITGMGKVWGQNTSDGRYALVYNPDLKRRWPLVMLTSDDGVTFRDPHALHGDLPPRRYEGKAKDQGLSYQRGLSNWNSDGSWNDSAMWLVYSLNKEDICVARVPIPSSTTQPSPNTIHF